jgi:hypothetical protein
MRRETIWILLVVVAGFAFDAEAATSRIIKVLPHLLDREGRHTLSPSLYGRDAYQAFLRKNLVKSSGMRFDIQWRARTADRSRLKLRVEIRGSNAANLLVVQQPVQPNHWYNRWSALVLDGDSYQKAGEMIAWRATLWEGDALLAEQKSFLW